MIRLRASAGSSSPNARPEIVSYWPAEPNEAPLNAGETMESMTMCLIWASELDAAAASSMSTADARRIRITRPPLSGQGRSGSMAAFRIRSTSRARKRSDIGNLSLSRGHSGRRPFHARTGMPDDRQRMVHVGQRNINICRRLKRATSRGVERWARAFRVNARRLLPREGMVRTQACVKERLSKSDLISHCCPFAFVRSTNPWVSVSMLQCSSH